MAFKLVNLDGGVGYFKGGLYGFAGAGKTYTATLFAIGIREKFGLKGPIAMFDTETGAEYVNPMVKKATGQALVGAKSRALSDAIEFVGECEKSGVSVAIVDSTTHIWEEVQKTFLKRLNEAREAKKLQPKTNIEWQDRGPLNDIWEKFTTAYLNSKLHIFICGRAANLWEMETNEETGKKELNKVGTKMKTQSEMAYEPSFLAEMAREQEIIEGKQVITRVMTVLKDRAQLLDGKQFRNPTFKDILPSIEFLTPGASNTVDTSRETPIKTTEGDAEWHGEKRQRAIHCENIQADLVSSFPGQSAEEKKAKVDILFSLFGTRSWTEIEGMSAEKLKVGLGKMQEAIADHQKREIAEKPLPDKKPGKAKESFITDAAKALENAGKEAK